MTYFLINIVQFFGTHDLFTKKIKNLCEIFIFRLYVYFFTCLELNMSNYVTVSTGTVPEVMVYSYIL